MTKKNTSIWILGVSIAIAVLCCLSLLFIDRITLLFAERFLIAEEQEKPRISKGNVLLLETSTALPKQEAVEAFAKKDYQLAIALFKSSLQIQPNDPETLIYLNNARAETKNPIKIAAVVSVSKNLNVANELLRGIAQAQNEINQAGGIKGRLLQIIIANDDNNPEIATQIASELLKDENILAVIGHGSSDTTLAAAPIYQNAGLVAIAPNSLASSLSGIGNYFFRILPGTRLQVDNLSRYILQEAKTLKIAMCTDSQAAYSRSYKREFSETFSANGGTIIETDCDLAVSEFDPDAEIAEAIEKGANGLLVAPAIDRVSIALELTKANRQRLALFGSHTLYTYLTLDSDRYQTNGMAIAVPWHRDAFAGNPFIKQAQHLWGGEVNWRTATAYDATKVIITGFERGDISRQALQKTLSDAKFVARGATGDISFSRQGDREGKTLLVKIKPGKKSGTGFDFVLLKDIKSRK
jgi:branched-chain amino acid transport system substrate-binding protein